MTYDLIVVGGGIGGSALAAVMARTGKSVLLLEKSTVYEDRVRGEWIAPWGVAEAKRLGLYDRLLAAGGHHLTSHVTYDETRDPAAAEAGALPLGMFAEGVAGPLCIRHPVHCQTLFDAAVAMGATALRDVTVGEIVLGDAPSVTYVHDGAEQIARAPLIVGAEGRQSLVRRAAGLTLHQDRPHHWFAGLLVDDVAEIDPLRQTIGTEGDFAFLTFPQGNGRVRVYGGWSLSDKARFAGTEGPRRFLDAFRLPSAPQNEAIANGSPAGPLFAYYNNCSVAERPHAPGAVLIGDAAGWNDPILGLGLSITYRDVRIVSGILKTEGGRPDFRPYAVERAERMRRLRAAAELQAGLDMEFGEPARERRRRYHEECAEDPALGMHGVAVLAGPETVPPDVFTAEHRARVLGA
ncbi:MAG: NAD(P)/FAD-dependent oxidoreductase [Sphingomonas adhaesiva]|uniref:FAD-dependent oxidoreductase n=1 Tax=Sphingomonas adhaesiva TaxID=28212 RepID=UPI002FF5AE51